MRNDVVGSALIHGVIVAVIFITRAVAPVIVPGPEVVQVALVDPSAVMPTMAPAPAPRQPERVPDVVEDEPEGVKLEPEKPKRKPEPEPPKETPTPPRDEPPPALPYQSLGVAGLKGQIAVDAADFEFTYYLVLVRNQIARNWSPPAGVNGSGVRATIYFRITRSGAIASPRVESPSAVEYFDRAALRAVVLADPLPPLPIGYPGRDLGVHFGFEYTGP